MTKERAKKVALTPAQERILAEAEAKRQLDESRYAQASDMVRSCLSAHEALANIKTVRNVLYRSEVSYNWGPSDNDAPQELRDAFVTYEDTITEALKALKVIEEYITRRFTTNYGYADEIPSVYLALVHGYKQHLIASDWQPKPKPEAEQAA